MAYQLHVNSITVTVMPKNIKNFYLAVRPPYGEICASVPLWMNEEQVKFFLLSKMEWIEKQRKSAQAQPREEAKEFINMETHYIWGQACSLKIHPGAPKNRILLENEILNIFIKGMPDKNRMSALLQDLYRQLANFEGSVRIEHWRMVFNLPPVNLHVRKMKTRWGSCLPLKNKILLNTELAKKPRECLDYVVAHELAHFFVPNHGKNFKNFMDKHLPDWKIKRQLLNSFPC